MFEIEAMYFIYSCINLFSFIPENGTIEEEQRLLEPSNSSIMPQSEKYEPKDRQVFCSY